MNYTTNASNDVINQQQADSVGMIYMTTIWTIDILMNCIGFFVHSLGIYAIIACKKKSNQVLILFNLSLVEIMIIMYMVANDIIRLGRYKNNDVMTTSLMESMMMNRFPAVYQEINFFIYLSIGVEMIFVMVVLTMDRLIFVLNPLRYKAQFTRSTLRKILIASWIISFIFGALYAAFKAFAILCIFGTIAIGYVVLAAVTYTIIYFKSRNSNLQFQANRSKGSHKTPHESKFRKDYMIPGLIILTYILCYILPFALTRAWIRITELTVEKCILHECLAIVLDIGFLSDALVYVMLTKHFRVAIMELFFACKQRCKQMISNKQWGKKPVHAGDVFVMKVETSI